MSLSRTTPGLLALAVVAAALIGSDDPAEEISSGEHLLALQHKVWANARETLKTDSPHLPLLTAVGSMVGERTRLRLETDYEEDNRAEVLAKLKTIGKAYLADVMTKLEATERGVQLRPGVTLAQLRQSFDRIDVEYHKFEAMTAPK